MRTYERVPSFEKRLTGVFCDGCKKAAPHPSAMYPWAEKDNRFAVEDVEITHRVGSHYPEGDFTEKLSPELCPACFKTHIVPALMAAGVEIKYGDTEGDGE